MPPHNDTPGIVMLEDSTEYDSADSPFLGVSEVHHVNVIEAFEHLLRPILCCSG